MADSAVTPQEYWGYLIRPDKSPSPVFEQLLLGVANYIVSLSPAIFLNQRSYYLCSAELARRSMGHQQPDSS